MPRTHAFTKVVDDNFLTTLRCLHGMLEDDPIQSRDQFKDLMKATFGRGHLDAKMMSSDLGFSASTVYRWVEGNSAPHRSLWPVVQNWLLASISTEISNVESHRNDFELVEA